MSGPSRRQLVAAAALAAALPARSQPQAAYPQRPVRLVVPFPPGGINDTVGRLLADAMAAPLGQPLIVDNRPGAAGLIGTQAVADAAPDGYTVLVTSTSNHVLAPLTQKAARVDPQRDLQPVALALRMVGLLVVPATLPVRTLTEFVALARRQPRQINYASSGMGSANHVMVEHLQALAGIALTQVPYRGGAPLLTALLAGEVQFALLDFATAESGLRSGRLRALAQTGTRRHVALPEVPTLAEAGVRDYDPAFWIGLAVPRATPPDIVQALNRALGHALAQTPLKARAQAFGWTLEGGPPARLAEIARREHDTYLAIVATLPADRP